MTDFHLTTTTPDLSDTLAAMRSWMNDAGRVQAAMAPGGLPGGAAPQGAASLPLRADEASANLVMTQDAASLARSFGGVTLPVQNVQWLALPCDPRSYGRSPLEFGDRLDFFVIHPGMLAAWRLLNNSQTPRAARPSTSAKAPRPRTTTTAAHRFEGIVFWGKPAVTQPGSPVVDFAHASLDQALTTLMQG